MKIPHPGNPEHVANLASISLLKAQNFRGDAMRLAISVFEYGLVWRELENEFLFVYRHPSIANKFDRCLLSKVTEPENEWGWALKSEFFRATGMEKDKWLALPLTQQVTDLVSYYGTANVFGSSYWKGFEISES